MIKDMKALSMVEASKYIENEELNAFVKKFTKMKDKVAAKMREELEKIGSMRIKEEHIAKIIDIMPEDSQDIAKIFSDVSLDENESSQILEIVKKYK